MRLSARKKQRNPRVKFNVHKLRDQAVKQEFKISLSNRFEALQTEEETIENTWTTLIKAVVGTCEEVLGRIVPNKKAMDKRRHLE